VFLGRISYSVYLLQFIIILAFLPHWLRLLNIFGVPQIACCLLVIIGGVAVTLGAAACMYFLIESPVIAFGHRAWTPFIKPPVMR
jgi:peptidoglycan/LPS O-acetylase OafA/YrhL